jgi:hypothetical protein
VPRIGSKRRPRPRTGATRPRIVDRRLVEGRPTGIVGVVPAPHAELDRAGVRVLELARHELAVAFRNAQLRAALELERLELGAIIDGATDAIIEVDTERRIRASTTRRELLGVPRRPSGEPAATSCNVRGPAATPSRPVPWPRSSDRGSPSDCGRQP